MTDGTEEMVMCPHCDEYQIPKETARPVTGWEAVADGAYWLLSWTHQHFLEGDPRNKERGIAALNKNRDHLNSAEQTLLDALSTYHSAKEKGPGDAALVLAARGAEKLLQEIEIVMGESYGVDGYHLNGDVIAWEQLDFNMDALTRLTAALSGEPQEPSRVDLEGLLTIGLSLKMMKYEQGKTGRYLVEQTRWWRDVCAALGRDKTLERLLEYQAQEPSDKAVEGE